VGLLNGDGSPSDAYKDFRDKGRGPALLAKEIRRAYKDLFDTYPDAHAQNDENLRNFFSGKTNIGNAAISFILGTFKVECEFGDFSNTQTTTLGTASAANLQLGAGSAPASIPAIHINLQIHLPEAADPTTYDAIFAAVNRHLGKLQ